ncbi:hypothetical protein F5Y03DRAFT_44899 [Xylaria venustula]|nr:hypothetical protein F5Y03DRAFT_44899 [Xylaria venustula]
MRLQNCYITHEILLEILNILRCTTKCDVLSCRLVCKRLSRVGEDIVFEDIILAPDQHGFQALLDLSNSPLRYKVKMLYCYFEVFDAQMATSLDLFAAKINQREVQEFWWAKTSHDLENRHQILERDFKIYQQGFYWQTLLEGGMYNTPVFAAALNRLENLRGISLSQSYAHSAHNEPDIGDDVLPDVTISPVAHAIFEALVEALLQCQGHIQELTLGYFPEEETRSTYDWGLVGMIQSLDPASYPRYQQAFGKLKRLTTVLPWTMGEDEELNYSGLSTLIRSAQSLESLCLTSLYQSLDSFPIDFLRSLHVPKLTTLILCNATFKEPTDLLALLWMHAETLQNVDFSFLVLEHDSWKMVFSKMRSVLSLESCAMQGLCVRNDGIDEEICLAEQSCLFYQTAENFIRRKTEDDPFYLLQVATVK